MIYLDSSVALARLLFERHAPPLAFWNQPLVSSQLLAFEIWNRIHAYDPSGSNRGPARALLMGIQLFPMDNAVLARALEPWPVPIRTLDALHLATADYLCRQGEAVVLASYDQRLLAAARALGIAAAAL